MQEPSAEPEFPLGFVFPWFSDKVPEGWVWCNGQTTPETLAHVYEKRLPNIPQHIVRVK